MHPPSVPASVGGYVRRKFLAVNAVPLGIGVALSCSTGLTAIQVYGRLTLGVVWAALQLGVFLSSVWWYESRVTRWRDPDEPQHLASHRDMGTASR